MSKGKDICCNWAGIKLELAQLSGRGLSFITVLAAPHGRAHPGANTAEWRLESSGCVCMWGKH